MLTYIAHGLAYLICIAVVSIGVRFLVAPQPATVDYGVPAKPDGDSAYLMVKGLRDLLAGITGLVLLVFTTTQAVAWFMLVLALTPLGDTFIVLRHGGTKKTAFGAHFTVSIVVFITATLLFIV